MAIPDRCERPIAITNGPSKKATKRKADDMDFEFDDPFFNSPPKKKSRGSSSDEIKFDLDYWSRIVDDIIRKRKKTPKKITPSPAKMSPTKGDVALTSKMPSPKTTPPIKVCNSSASQKKAETGTGSAAQAARVVSKKGKVARMAKQPASKRHGMKAVANKHHSVTQAKKKRQAQKSSKKTKLKSASKKR